VNDNARVDAMTDERIIHLRELRLQIAARARLLAERDLDARLLRHGIEGEKRTQGASQSAAEKDARVDPGYVAFERASAALTEERDQLLAEAGALRLELLLVVGAGTS
jgi:hypothetical protein